VIRVSLRRRIMLLVTIGLIVATAPLGVMGIGMLRAATDRILGERLAMTQATADHLNEQLTQAWRQLEYLSRTIGPLWLAGERDTLRGTFAVVAPALTLFSGEVFLIDRAGRPVLQAPAARAGRIPRLEDVPSVRVTLATGRSAVSRLVSAPDGRPVVIFSVSVRDPAGAVVGIVGGILSLPSPVLQGFVDRLRLAASGHAAIVSADGTVLASTNPDALFTRNEHPEYLAALIARQRAQVGSTADVSGPGGADQDHVMAFSPLVAAPWGLTVGEDAAETFRPIRRLRDRVILFAVAVLSIALFFAWLDTGAVAGPIRLLKEAAEAIAGGDLRRQVAVRRADEIGALASSFEQMRVRLLDSLEEIRRRARASEALYGVGTEVLSLQDRDAVLSSIAGRAAELLQADVAVICLVDESQTVRVSARTGPAEALHPGPHRLPPEPRAPDDLECPNLQPEYRRAHLAAPLIIAGRTVGALCVGAQITRALSPQDREVLHGLANLAAIAVENARLQERVQSLAVVEERERLAREMHDSVGQVLGYVNTKAQAVKVLLDAGRTGEAQAQLVELEQAALEVYADLREAILGLRAEVSPDRHFVAVLQEYVRRFGELSGITTDLVTEGDPARYRFSPTTELHLLRIIQEALTNVRKHAAAGRAWVRLTERDGRVTVAVQDDGLGFDPTRPPFGGWPRFGLQTMRERAEAIGGTFAVRRRERAGTEVTVEFPIVREKVDARPAGG